MVGPDSVNSSPSRPAAFGARPLPGSNVTSRYGRPPITVRPIVSPARGDVGATIGNPTPIDSISGMFWTLQLKSDRPSGAIVNAPARRAARPAARELDLEGLTSRGKPTQG